MKPRWAIAVVASVLASAGCGRDPSSSRARRPGPPAPTPAPPQPRGSTGLTFPLDPPSPSPLDAVPVFTGIELRRPVFSTHAPGRTDRIFVVEQAGRILAFDRRDDVDRFDVVLDIRDRVRMRHNEEGLLGLAFDPGYATNRKVYVYYSASGPRRIVLSRFGAHATADRIDPGSEEVLLEVEQPWGNHNGGMIAFGPDGHLYVGLGDGGSAGDPHDAGQDPDNLLGKILRLEVDPKKSGYQIPPDNPFVGQKGIRPEIHALGLRNPWRFSFDRQTGVLWCGDVGQDSLEEIDIVRPGGNYGWRLREGTRPFDRSRHRPMGPSIDPVVEYGRDLGESVTGGYVYRGTAMPAFRGAYFYGDYVTGTVWALVHDGQRVVSNDVVARVPSLSSFGEDARGELYGVSLDGAIYRFQVEHGDDAGTSFPTTLSQTGLFVDTKTLQPSPALMPYDVAVQLWSDGAQKKRWLVLPPGKKIGFDPEHAWTFPVGTVTVKHFELDLQPGQAGGNRRLETRVMVHERHGWSGYTYRWNEAQTDATLLSTPQTETFTIVEGGKTTPVTWYFPAGSDCLRCHTPGYGEALGLRTRQLNHDGVDGESILAVWNERGLFDRDIGDPSRYAAHPDSSDDTSIRRRARAYLDVNCAPCHHPGGPAPGSIDMRVQTPLSKTGLIGMPPEQSVGLPGEQRIAAGRHRASSVWARMTARDAEGMPPLASNRVDTEGSSLLAGWIDSLEPQ